jgi:hypothetical protein
MRCKHVCLHKHKEEKQPSLRCNSEDECCLQSRQANAHWRERGQVSRKLVNINFRMRRCNPVGVFLRRDTKILFLQTPISERSIVGRPLLELTIRLLLAPLPPLKREAL